MKMFAKKTLSARTNFVQNVVQNHRGHNLILKLSGLPGNKSSDFLSVGIKFFAYSICWKKL